MRLIDADALYEHAYSGWISGKARFIVDYASIKNAPTIDAASVVRGKWEFKLQSDGHVANGLWCSNCHISYSQDYNYCPNCGVKMGETQNDSNR